MEFTPFLLLDTDNILESLQIECQKRAISIDDVQCHLQQYHTHISDSNLPSHALLDDTIYHSDTFTIHQTYEILVRPKYIEDTFVITLSNDKDKAFMRCFDNFLALEEMREELYAQIGARLAMLGVILRDMENLRTRIDEILHTITLNPKSKAREFCLIHSSIYVPPKPMRFVFFPQENYRAQKRDQGFFDNETIPPPSKIEEAFYGVDKDELIAVYEFGDRGVAGRNLLGQFCPQADEKPRITPSNQANITTKLYPDKIEYFSQVRGFIALHNQYTAHYASHTPTSQDQSDLFCFYTPASSGLTSTKTPPLLCGVQAHITLHIESTDSADAIGDGVYIEAERVEINGNLGSHTTIKAKHLYINGATHKSSKILTQYGKILTHRGLLIAQDCTIKNVDSGTIYADTAVIQETIASTIYATSIHINRLRNANFCHFATTLQVEEIPQNRGNENALIFSPLGSSRYRDYLYNARIYHQHKSHTLAQLESTLKALLPKLHSAQNFLQKLQGFTKQQQAIALKDSQFAKTYRESLFLVKFYKTTLMRKTSLEQALHTLHDMIKSLHTKLIHAHLQIGKVMGFDNYAHIQELSLEPSTTMLESLLLECNKSYHITAVRESNAPSELDSPTNHSIHLKASQ